MRGNVRPKRAEPRQRNISWIISLFIAATKTCPISPAMPKSRDIASRASASIAGEGSGISIVFSSPWHRIVIANWGAAGCDTSFCSRTCAMPTAQGAGTVLPLTSAVWRPEPLGKIIRRKLIPNLEHVTWRDPTVTPSRLAISSRLIPAATNSLIFSIACGVNLARLPTSGRTVRHRHGYTFGSRPPVVVWDRYRVHWAAAMLTPWFGHIVQN